MTEKLCFKSTELEKKKAWLNILKLWNLACHVFVFVLATHPSNVTTSHIYIDECWNSMLQCVLWHWSFSWTLEFFATTTDARNQCSFTTLLAKERLAVHSTITAMSFLVSYLLSPEMLASCHLYFLVAAGRSHFLCTCHLPSSVVWACSCNKFQHCCTTTALGLHVVTCPCLLLLLLLVPCHCLLALYFVWKLVSFHLPFIFSLFTILFLVSLYYYCSLIFYLHVKSLKNKLLKY